MTKKLRAPTQGRKASELTATRAVLQAGGDELPRIILSVKLDDASPQANYELNIHQAGLLIEQLMASYNAILPPLRTSRGGFGL